MISCISSAPREGEAGGPSETRTRNQRIMRVEVRRYDPLTGLLQHIAKGA